MSSCGKKRKQRKQYTKIKEINQELKEKWAEEYRRAVRRSVVNGNQGEKDNQGSNRTDKIKE